MTENQNSDSEVLIPEGEYTVIYRDYYFRPYINGIEKLYIHFEIAEGIHKGTLLDSYYNASRQKDPSGVMRISAGKRSDLVRDLYRSTDGLALQSTIRPDRLNPNVLEGLHIRARVKTVTKDRRGDKLAGPSQYSKIEMLRKPIDIGTTISVESIPLSSSSSSNTVTKLGEYDDDKIPF